MMIKFALIRAKTNKKQVKTNWKGADMQDYITYTADDEEPDCMLCENANADDRFCKNNCGAEHGWSCYMRKEQI